VAHARVRATTTTVSAAQLEHLAIVKATVERRNADAQLAADALAAAQPWQSQLFTHPVDRELPRSFAVLEIKHGLVLVEQQMRVINLLLARHSEQITRLEEGTFAMERQIASSERALARVRRIGVARSIGIRLALIGVVALLCFLLLV